MFLCLILVEKGPKGNVVNTTIICSEHYEADKLGKPLEKCDFLTGTGKKERVNRSPVLDKRC